MLAPLASAIHVQRKTYAHVIYTMYAYCDNGAIDVCIAIVVLFHSLRIHVIRNALIPFEYQKVGKKRARVRQVKTFHWKLHAICQWCQNLCTLFGATSDSRMRLDFVTYINERSIWWCHISFFLFSDSKLTHQFICYLHHTHGIWPPSIHTFTSMTITTTTTTIMHALIIFTYKINLKSTTST